MSVCPGDERLARLLEEQLDAVEQSDIEQHLELCDSCQESLEELTRERFSFSGWQPWSDADHVPDPSFDGSASSFQDAGEWSPRRRRRSRPDRPPTLPISRGDNRAGDEIPEVEGYEILGRLGQGGMGVVYKARQDGLDRLVALKMIRGGPHAAPEHLARFRIEARSVARLKHPNVVQIFDVGRASGLPFVALELLEGGSLEARVAGTPQPERASAELLVTLAGAIAAAHRAGVVHRDLKSGNVLFAADGTPKVADFGLAKRLDEEDGQTHSGQVMGSPSFMSPEQARGEGREVGPPADIYSLGAILYEMLTGRPPFKGASAMETLLQVVHEEPLPPSRLRPGIASDLETICLKCLAKDPARRYGSAEALAEDLRRYLAGSPIAARRVGPVERSWKWARRHPAAASLVVVALGVGLGLGYLGYGSVQRDQAAERVRMQAVGVMTEGRMALRVGDWDASLKPLNDFLAEVGPNPRLDDVRRDVRGLVALLEARRDDGRSVDEARRRFGEFRRLRRRAQVVDNRIVGAGELGDVEATRRAALAAIEAFPASGWVDDAPAAELPGSLSGAQKAEVDHGRRELMMIWVEALNRPALGEDPRLQAQRALEVLDRLARRRPPARAERLLRAVCLASAGEVPAAELERLVAERMPIDDAAGHVFQGRELYRRRQWSEAIGEFERALTIEPVQFRAQFLMAVCQLQVGKFEQARVGLTACLQREPGSVGLLLLRGFASGEQGYRQLKLAREARPASDPSRGVVAEVQFDAAEADYTVAAALHPQGSELYGLLVNRGALWLRRDRLDEAVADLLGAVELAPDQVTARVTLGQAYRKQGRTDEAIAQFDACIRLKPDQPALYRSRALARLDRGRPSSEARETAIADLTEAIRREKPGSKDWAADLARRARLLMIAGRPDEALADCEDALGAAPDDPEALAGRVKALLELKRFDAVVGACDDALARGKPSAELYELRGLARSGRREYSGAIQDFTQALTIDPARPVPLIQRGWAYLVSGAPRLALTDFDQAVRVAPMDPDAHNGRGLALAYQGQHHDAVLAAERAIQHAGDDPRTPYNAARVYVKAAASVVADAPRRNLGQARLADDYLDRAQALVRQSLERMPAERRASFWSDVVQADPALAALRQRPKFSQLAGPSGRQSR